MRVKHSECLWAALRDDVESEALAAGCCADALGKLCGVAEPAGADARVRDAGEAV